MFVAEGLGGGARLSRAKEESSCTPAGKSHSSSSSSWGGWRPLLRMTPHPWKDASKVARERGIDDQYGHDKRVTTL